MIDDISETDLMHSIQPVGIPSYYEMHTNLTFSVHWDQGFVM